MVHTRLRTKSVSTILICFAISDVFYVITITAWQVAVSITLIIYDFLVISLTTCNRLNVFFF